MGQAGGTNSVRPPQCLRGMGRPGRWVGTGQMGPAASERWVGQGVQPAISRHCAGINEESGWHWHCQQETSRLSDEGLIPKETVLGLTGAGEAESQAH